MAKFRYAIVAGCLLISGCNGRPIDTSHFNPIFQTRYSPRPYIDPLETSSTVARTAPVVAVKAVETDRIVSAAVAPDRAQPRANTRAQARVSSSDISESSSRTSTNVPKDGYTVSAGGKIILPPSSRLEIIDVAQINRVMEARSADADVMKIEADEAARGARDPAN